MYLSFLKKRLKPRGEKDHLWWSPYQEGWKGSPLDGVSRPTWGLSLPLSTVSDKPWILCRLPSFNITNYPLTEIHNLFPLVLTCRRGPYSELEEQCEVDEAPHVLEGSGLTTAPVDGMGSFRYKNLSLKIEHSPHYLRKWWNLLYSLASKGLL